MSYYIFIDQLEANQCSGVYTLKALLNGVWTNIATITGVSNGEIIVDQATYAIPVDPQLFFPNIEYNLLWVDSNGVQSNIRQIIIPYTYGTNYYKSSVPSYPPGYSYNSASAYAISGSGYTSANNYIGPIGGDNLNTLELIKVVSNEGKSTDPTIVNFTALLSAGGLLIIYNLTEHTSYIIGEGPWDYTDVTENLPGFTANEGDSLQLGYIDQYGNVTTSNIYTIPLTSGGSAASTFNAISLLGVSDDGSGLCSIAYEAWINNTDNELWLVRTNVSNNTTQAVGLTVQPVGHTLRPNVDLHYLTYNNGDTYQLCLINTTANPSLNLSDPNNLLSNVLTAQDLAITSVSAAGGGSQIMCNANVTLNGTLQAAYPGVGISNITNTPAVITQVGASSSVQYRAGQLVQLQVVDSNGNVLAASVYSVMV